MTHTKKAPTGGNRIGAGQDGLQTHPVPIVTHAHRTRKRVRFRRTICNELIGITAACVVLGIALHIGIRMACLAIIAIFGF